MKPDRPFRVKASRLFWISVLFSMSVPGSKTLAHVNVAGTEADRTALATYLSAATNKTVEIDGSGNMTMSGDGSDDNAAAKRLRAAIADDVTTGVKVGCDLPRVLVGAYQKNDRQLIDLDDIQNMPASGQPFWNRDDCLIHEITEAYQKDKYNKRYDLAHAEAVQASNEVYADTGAGREGNQIVCPHLPNPLTGYYEIGFERTNGGGQEGIHTVIVEKIHVGGTQRERIVEQYWVASSELVASHNAPSTTSVRGRAACYEPFLVPALSVRCRIALTGALLLAGFVLLLRERQRPTVTTGCSDWF